MDASVPSKDVGYLRIGMAARVKLDAFDYQKYGTLPGQIQFISPDSQVMSDGALAYLVRITLDQTELADGTDRRKVKIGMTGLVEMIKGEERLLSLAVRRFRNKLTL